ALLLAMISVMVSKSKSQWLPEAYHEKKELHQKHLFYLQMDSLKQATAKTFNNRSALAAMDTLLAKMDSSYIRSDNDSLNFIRSFINLGKQDTLMMSKPGFKVTADSSRKVRIALDDVENMEEDSLLAKYKINGFWEKVFVRQQIRVSKNGDNFMPFLISNTLWMMLVMMPLLALVLKLLYVRRDYFYFEHLIFSFHVHSFMFLFTAILLFFSKWMEDWAEPVVSLSLLVTGIYPLIAMKRFYRQGWMKTTAKYLISNFLYFILSAFAVMLLAFVSFVLF
ncbi:MAG: hypothetical protein IT258_23640, partial [Saprospiraceae bacterium]|nr:hypothetical protein [Saprospiraceae bacterium]